MNWAIFPLFLAVFLFAASFVAGILLSVSESRFSEKRLMRKRLMYMSAGGMHGKERFELYKKDALETAGPLMAAIYRIPRINSLDRLLIRSKVPLHASTFVLLSLAMAAVGAFAGTLLQVPAWLGVMVGIPFGALPWFVLRRNEAKFVAAFEEQLPEALDFIVRAMRSGHAFTSAMEMGGKELSAPVGPELTNTVDQIKFGLSTEDALENMCQRTAVGDLRFFTIAVILHKEAGGNITEVFSKISQIIRDRLRFRRQVRALTAEGRFSAIALLLIPPALFVYIYVVNFEYISLLWLDQAGRVMVALSVVSQVIGYFVMRKMAQLDM